MSNTWTWEHAIRDSKLQPTTKLVLYTLALYMNKMGGGAFPSNTKLANDTGLSKRCVISHITIAESEGFLIKEKRTRENGSCTTNQYKAQIPSAGGSLGGCTTFTRGVQEVHEGGERSDTPIPNHLPNQPTKENKKENPYLDEAVLLFNIMAEKKGLAKVMRLTAARKTKLAARLEDCGGIVGWQLALDKLGESSFCTGDNDRGWKANFDFILKESSFTKLIEGAYNGNKNTNGKYTASDALGEVLAEIRADSANGGAVLCSTEHLREDTTAIENFNEGYDNGFTRIPTGRN